MKEIVAVHTDEGPGLEHQFDSELWSLAPQIRIELLWQGERAPSELETTARLLWTDDELVINFHCACTELDIDEEYDLGVERYGLWDRDVVEAFIRSPLEGAITSYREFEVAPTGQWCDLLIDRATMVHDWEWKSGMRTSARIDHSRSQWDAAMAIPFSAFGVRPSFGDVWRGNLFRVSRFKGERKYLALSPNSSKIPNYHVPESFVTLRFQ